MILHHDRILNVKGKGVFEIYFSESLYFYFMNLITKGQRRLISHMDTGAFVLIF